MNQISEISISKDLIGRGLPSGVFDALADRDMVSWEAVAAALMSYELQSNKAVASYVAFLKLELEKYQAIAEVYDLRSPPGSDGKKSHLRLSEPEDMLFIANALYVLDAHGVGGVVLECGCSHGYSTCCLSHACHKLGRTLYVADSFEGLPDTDGDEFFEKGDYAASIEEVRGNLDDLGHASVATFVPGWFSESLKDWHEEIAVLWLDVDLYASARDAVSSVAESLKPSSAIFSHEFTDFYGKPVTEDEKSVPRAISDALKHSGREHRAHIIKRYLGTVALEDERIISSLCILLHMLPNLKGADTRARAHEELLTSRTYRTAVGIKNLLRGRTT